jgi:nucleoprotein TPR
MFQAPILSQQRIEYERLQVEAAQLGSQLSQALAERDTQQNTSQELSQKLTKSTNENTLLQRQLEDLGRQVQNLLRQIARRDDPTIPPDEELEMTPVEAITDAATLVTDHLVLFKNIDVLQQQNIRLLRIVRDLGEKMENDEKEYRETMEKEQAEAIREAHEAMQELAAQLEAQKKNSDLVIKAYVQERDALRAMLDRAQSAAGTDASASAIGTTLTVSGDAAKELAEVQGQFDAYKLEMGIDSGRLRDELIAAQKEFNSMSAALAKANAKVEYLSGKGHILANASVH